MKNEEQFLKKVLYNPFLRTKFKRFDENRKHFYRYSKEEYIEKLEPLIFSEIEKMNQETFDIELIVSWLENILKDYYFEDIYLFVCGRLNELIRKKAIDLNVDIELYATYISELCASDEYKQKEKESINKYLDFKNDTYIIDAQFERFVFALNTKNDMQEENFKYVFNLLLDKNYKISEGEYKNFFLRFCLFAMKEFGLENNHVAYQNNLKVKARYELQLDENGNKKNTISFRSNLITPQNIMENLIAFFHEVTHGVQIAESNTLYRIDKIKQLEDRILRAYLGEQFYDSNYYYISYETDAVTCSQILLSYFLNSCAPLTYRKEKENIRYLINGFLQEEKNNQRRIYNEKDDLQKVFSSFLLSHLQILNDDVLDKEQKAVLLQVYNEDGTPKTPDHYFKEKEQLLLQLQNSFLDDAEQMKKIKKKIDFYDAILLSFEYSIENLKRNYIALEQYQSNNPEIMAEVFQYKNNIMKQLIDSDESTRVMTTQERVMK